ncbi:hypothetical protein Leryth_025790 [Lithospermum erythrorhizon]|uniref:Uncharacterized protein n=1 Tax=Lithospermum erythrorhizon TaxID=34254 RepID=A0AAV3R150_LITER|nr:hypothetical protein Leryth_025790 [Lithospermum erythrorhizon]
MCNAGMIPTKRILSKKASPSLQRTRPKRYRIRIHKLRKNVHEEKKLLSDHMVLKNLRLYMENMSILEANEKLKKKLILLHQENNALMTQLQNKYCFQSSRT